MNELRFRDYRSSDIRFLKKAVAGCWGHSFFVGDPIVDDDVALNFLSMFLEESNCSRVAVIDSIPVGFIFGHIFSEQLWSGSADAHRDRASSADRLNEDCRCRDYLDYYSMVFDLYRKAVMDSGMEYDSEIVLLTVDPEFHDRGIGRSLLEEIGYVLKDKGANNTFLFTSGFSDHDFYLHVGFDLVFKTSIDTGHFGEVGVYIYSREL